MKRRIELNVDIADFSPSANVPSVRFINGGKEFQLNLPFSSKSIPNPDQDNPSLFRDLLEEAGGDVYATNLSITVTKFPLSIGDVDTIRDKKSIVTITFTANSKVPQTGEGVAIKLE